MQNKSQNDVIEVNLKKICMGLTEEKEALLHIVEDPGEKLTGLLIALANGYHDADQNYSKEEMDFFNNRGNFFYNSNKEGFSIEGARDTIRRNYSNGV